jgi:mRNA-degrading endonuclease RelE of RelBE toxin-antitoxin system
MDGNKNLQEILLKMEEIKAIVIKQIESNQKIKDIKHCDDLQLGQIGIEGAYIVEIENEKRSKETGERLKTVVYKVYAEDHTHVANIDEKGNVEYAEEFLEQLKDVNEEQLSLINTKGVKLQEEPNGKNEISYKEEKGKQEETNRKREEENRQIEEIAKQKGIPTNNVLKVRADSNFYKNHPELEEEPNLYFYRDEDGKIKAEYIDEKGIIHPSKYFEESTTALSEQTVDLGQDGNPVKKKVPYQTMKTNLNGNDEDIKAVRINIEIVQGYLIVKESRLGKNGKWESHEIEVMGRDYNSKEVNDVTSTRLGGEADPSRVTNMFKKVEQTSLADDGIQMEEMQEYRESLINKFIDEGYNREEATKIYNYMIEKSWNLTEEQAKDKVNEEIRNNTDYGENEGGRTPGEDAYDRLTMRGKPY